MIAPQLLRTLFIDTHVKIMEATAQLTHEESIQDPSSGGNSIHWIVGHIVVARCNFLMLLDVASIWDSLTCRFFIPGSDPSVEAADHLQFTRILNDLDTTQDQLLDALDRSDASDLGIAGKERTVGEQITEYAAHEAYHAGQLTILRKALE